MTTQKQRILVIDDHHMMREFLTAFLSKKYDVHTATNGKEALEWIDFNSAPDLILVDLDMPVMNGLDFLETLKKTGMAANAVKMVLSAADNSNDRILAYELGASDLIKKPFNPRELELKIFNKAMPKHTA